MDQAKWQGCQNPQAMLAFLRSSGELTDRKARFFVVALCRQLSHLFTHEYWDAVEVAERYATGAIDVDALEWSWSTADFGLHQVDVDDDGTYQAAEAACVACSPPPAAGEPSSFLLDAVARTAAELPIEPSRQAALLRCIWNPFTVLPPTVGSASAADVARTIVEEKALPSGVMDNQRLAVLADLLEESGCQDDDLLSHLRDPKAIHVHGCWAVDTVLVPGIKASSL